MPALTHSAAFLMEQKRLAGIADKTAALRAQRLVAESQRSARPVIQVERLTVHRSNTPRGTRCKAAETSVDGSEWVSLSLAVVKQITGAQADAQFQLADFYEYEDQFAKKFPLARHVRDHMRWCLQVLRESGYIVFIDNRGTYGWAR